MRLLEVYLPHDEDVAYCCLVVDHHDDELEAAADERGFRVRYRTLDERPAVMGWLKSFPPSP